MDRCILACLASNCGQGIASGCFHICWNLPSDAAAIRAAQDYLDVVHTGGSCFRARKAVRPDVESDAPAARDLTP